MLELDQEVEQLVFNQLDKVIRPEASGGQLDLSKNEFRVNDKFSIQKAKQLHQSRNANAKFHAKSAYSDLSNDVYDDGGKASKSRQNNNLSIQSQEHAHSFRSESKKYEGKISHQQKLLKQVSSKFLDATKYHSKRLLDKEPSLNSIVYDSRRESNESKQDGSAAEASAENFLQQMEIITINREAESKFKGGRAAVGILSKSVEDAGSSGTSRESSQAVATRLDRHRQKANTTLLEHRNRIQTQNLAESSRSRDSVEDNDPSKDYHYKGNMQDLKPFF